MTSSSDTTSAPPPSFPIPLPAETPKTPAERAGFGPRERTLLLLAAVLAFLLASFPARNSDLWMHLAAGRQLAQGHLPPHTDSWLFDLLSYALYATLGGTALVLAKALLVAVLAVVTFVRSREGEGGSVAFLGTALALLAMSIRLPLQPAIVSCLLLALALWLIQKRAGQTAEALGALTQPRSLLLFLLFAIWVNLDRGFLLGLVVVALAWLGEVLDEVRADASAGRWRTILLSRAGALALLAAVCLLNPEHIHAFTFDSELSGIGTGRALRAGQPTSPFQAGYLTRVGLTPAAIAYFVLLGLSALSFLANLPRWHARRLLPWLGLAVWSAFQARTIPFFAVVAGPVLAWNLQEAIRHHLHREGPGDGPWQRSLALGRGLTVVAALVLPLCAWPGWLQSTTFEPRRWAVELPPSLARAAEAMRGWYQQGKLNTEGRGLHLTPTSIHAFAWWCPEEQAVLLDQLISGSPPQSAEDWQRRLHSANITHVVLYDPDHQRLFEALDQLVTKPEQWPLLYQEGDLAIFGWRDPDHAAEADPFRGWHLDRDALAFQPAEDKWAPDAPPDRVPEERRWWEAFWKPLPPRSLDSDNALMYLLQAETLRRSAPARHQAVWDSSQTVALLGAPAGWTTPANLIDARLHLALLLAQPPAPDAPPVSVPIFERMTLRWQQSFTRQRDDTPPAVLYLAVRAARRALAANPDNERAYLVLGESYLRLLRDTRERVWAGRLSEIASLRQIQASTALNQALTLKPNYARAHLRLGQLYRDMGYLDLALHHLKTNQRLHQEAGPTAAGGAERFQAEANQLREEVDQLAKRVSSADDDYVLRSTGAPVFDRALLAYRNGLAGKARDLLLESHLSAFGAPGMELELELLLGTGRARDARDWLLPEHKEALKSPPKYHWIRLRALAATGNYAEADEEASALAQAIGSDPEGQTGVPFPQNIALLIGQTVLDAHTGGGALPYEVRRLGGPAQFTNSVLALAQQARQRADVSVLRALIALERGASEEAEILCRDVLRLWKDEETAASGGGLDFNGRIIAQTYLRWLEQARQKEPQ